MPEAGKADFTNRFTSRVARVLARYPKALHVVLSDGALWNWQLIKEQYQAAILPLSFYNWRITLSRPDTGLDLQASPVTASAGADMNIAVGTASLDASLYL